MIYCRVKGEETQKQGRDRHEEKDERRRKEAGIDRGDFGAVGGNKERGQVKAQQAQRKYETSESKRGATNPQVRQY